MKLKVTKSWHKNEQLSNLFFFAQRMDELFFDYTLDTYKPPALNTIFLCREAIKLINDIEQNLIDSANLNHVLDELKWSLRQDNVASLMLEAPIECFLKYGEKIKISETKLKLEVLERILHPLDYLEVSQSLIKELIENNAKRKLDMVTRSYASNLINMGVSKQHLYEKTQAFFFQDREITSFDELDEYFKSITVISHHYEIYFLVSDLINELNDSISTFDLKVINSLPDKIASVAKDNKLAPKADEVWVEVVGIESYDRHSARSRAEEKLDMVRDLFLLFSHKNKISWRDESIITQCCEELPLLIRKPKNSMEKCFDLRPKDASSKLNTMIKTMGLRNNSFIKFHRVVDLHAISTTNDLPENQILNIWIALETLVPSQVSASGKIVKVTKGIMPILLRNYIPRLIQRLSADLIRWNRKKVSRILREIKEPEDKGLYQKVLELVAFPRNKTILNKLLEELDIFPLLRNRLFEFSDMFSGPKKVMDRIEAHEQKVTWQLRRIYRTRNLIVHSGSSISYIETLIENAHDYLDQTIESILNYTCGSLHATSIEQAFEMASIEHEVYSEELKRAEEFNDSNIWIGLEN